MSDNRRNNHYHYAEKYADSYRPRHGRTAFVPFKSVVISLVVLLMFGFISLTFSTYISEDDPLDLTNETVSVLVRNMKADFELAPSAASADIASTGGGQYNYNWNNVKLYFRAPDDWDIDTYDKVQGVITRASTVSSSAYATYTGAMTRLANTRLFYVSFSFNHEGWKQYEYFAVVANSSAKTNSGDGIGDQVLNTNKYYTNPMDYGLANNTYLGTATGNATNISFSYLAGSQASHYNTLFKKAQTVNLKVGSSASTACGTVTLTGYYNSANGFPITLTSSSVSSTLNSTSTASYDGVEGSLMTLTASPAAGYRFDGFYNSDAIKVSAGDNLTYSYYIFGAATYTAKFVQTRTVTVAKTPAAYTGTPTANTQNPSVTVDAGSTVALVADVKTGVTFNGWTLTQTSGGAAATASTDYTLAPGDSLSISSCTITPKKNLTATASYTLDAPTITTFSYADAPMVEGAGTITPSTTITSAAGVNGSLSHSYSCTSGQAADTYSLDTSTGAFSSSIAGNYTIRLSVSDAAYGLTSSATADFTITVKPVAPTSIEVDASGMMQGEGTYIAPYKIAKDTNNFSIHSWIPIADRNANYTYNWTRSDGTYSISDGATTLGSHTKTLTNNVEVTDDTAAATLSDPNHVLTNQIGAADTGYIYQITVTSSRNGVDSDPCTVTYYYGVTADFLTVRSFNFSSANPTNPIQKIYAEENAITGIDATYEKSGTTFHSMLWYSKNNITYDKVAVWAAEGFTMSNSDMFDGYHSALPDDLAHTTDDLLASFSTVARNSVNLMSVTGPKWFMGFIDDYQNPRITYQAPLVHTTVGTSSTSSDRPIYFKNSTGTTFVNSRLMAFYRVEGDGTTDVHYQTGQIFTKGGTQYYRFYVPSDVTVVTFAYVAKNNYVLPTFDGSRFSYAMYTDHTVLMGWTAQIDFSAPANLGKNVYTATAAEGGLNEVKSISGTLSNVL